MKRAVVIMVAVLAMGLPLLAACGDETSDSAAPEASSEDVAGVIAADSDLSTMSSAIDAARFGETLAGPGPFTVLAPNNAAFEALPPGTLDQLLADPSGALTDLLNFHVIPEKHMAADLAAGKSVETLLGEKIYFITGKDGKLYVNDLHVVRTDLVGSNGVVQVIDGVLIPPTD